MERKEVVEARASRDIPVPAGFHFFADLQARFCPWRFFLPAPSFFLPCLNSGFLLVDFLYVLSSEGVSHANIDSWLQSIFRTISSVGRGPTKRTQIIFYLFSAPISSFEQHVKNVSFSKPSHLLLLLQISPSRQRKVSVAFHCPFLLFFHLNPKKYHPSNCRCLGLV